MSDLNKGKWIYFNYDKEIIEKYRRNIDEDNLATLKKCFFIGSIAFILVALFSIFIDEHIKRSILASIASVVFMFLLYIAIYFQKHLANISSKSINKLITYSTIFIYSIAIYLGTFEADNDLAVTVIWVFLFMQVILIWLPIRNLCIIIPISVAFIICSYIAKDFSKVQYDTMHTIIIVSIGIFMSWNKSKLKLDYFITTDELREKNKILYYSSITDALTGLYNRKKIFEIYYEVGERCIKNNSKFSCLVIDIDDFKKYNDKYGHPKGDELLKNIGRTFIELSKDSKINIGRIGGEEFLAVWETNSRDISEEIAIHIKQSVEALNIEHKGSSVSKVVTISEGLSISDPNKIMKLEEAYISADNELYKSKISGKNCCCVKELN